MPNRLALEDSPYLQQHKDNPVDWWPWCDEAFAKAKEENKAIFISIGYSSCHWCHVMEEKVFEDMACAEILNKHFISIKVDREERPDIDKHYQEVHLLLNRRSGGWPTSIFATPQNKAFFAGTYIPPESSAGSVSGMGFKELTTLIATKIEENDPKLFENADEIQKFITHKEHPKEATVLKEDFVKNFLLQAKNNYDTTYGGFSVAPKFPHATTLRALMSVDALFDDKSARAMVATTLDSMIQGGMYDLVDGGFCRYSVDEKFLVPHFEKMLYDNALLCEVYTKSYLRYKNERHLEIAKEIADFWHNFMCEENLLYSASDADSEGEEGTYFIYSYDEVYEALAQKGFEDIQAIMEKLSVTHHGNFEGANIIRIEDTKVPQDFMAIKRVLQEIRKNRPYPFIDKKIQTSWSSMMIHSLFTLGAIDAKYTQRAKLYLDALMKSLYLDGKLYHTTLIHKEPKVEAFLEDYAFLSRALIAAYEQTFDELYLIEAQRLANKALELYYNKGEWSFSVGDFATKAEISDSTYTSSVSIMLDVLLSLATLLEDEKYSHFAFKTLEYNSYELGRRTIYYPFMLEQMLRYLRGSRVIKATPENLTCHALALKSLEYPFISLKSSSEDGFMVCGEQSCFAQTDDISKLNSLITNSF